MARKPKATELSTGIALGERLATLEAGFRELQAFVQTRVRWLIVLAASAVMQQSGVPLLEKFGAFLREIGLLARHAIGF
jgi:hypothetical protein